MLNYKEIIKRIENLIQSKELTASGFAEKIGVQRSSISHIISGRNKPSLEFLIKITEVFPETSLSELVYGNKSSSNHTNYAENDSSALDGSKSDNSQLQMKLDNSGEKKNRKIISRTLF